MTKPPSDENSETDGDVAPFEQTFEYPSTSISVQASIDNLHINQSGLAALERLSERNPQLAHRIVEAGEAAAHIEYKRYKVGASSAAAIAGSIVICSALVVIFKGFWAGLAFFVACAAASAVVSAIFTGNSQDLSWTVDFFKTKFRESTKDDPEE